MTLPRLILLGEVRENENDRPEDQAFRGADPLSADLSR